MRENIVFVIPWKEISENCDMRPHVLKMSWLWYVDNSVDVPTFFGESLDNEITKGCYT